MGRPCCVDPSTSTCCAATGAQAARPYARSSHAPRPWPACSARSVARAIRPSSPDLAPCSSDSGVSAPHPPPDGSSPQPCPPGAATSDDSPRRLDAHAHHQTPAPLRSKAFSAHSRSVALTKDEQTYTGGVGLPVRRRARPGFLRHAMPTCCIQPGSAMGLWGGLLALGIPTLSGLHAATSRGHT